MFLQNNPSYMQDVNPENVVAVSNLPMNTEEIEEKDE